MKIDWKHEHQEDEVTPQGGIQSKIHRDWTVVPWAGMAQIVPVLEDGAARRGRDNWRLISYDDHFKHLFDHTICCSVVQETEAKREHLTHIICRALFALETLDNDITQ